MAKHLAVNAEYVIADFVTLSAFKLFVSLFAHALQFLYRCANQEIHRHVSALTERRKEFFEHKENFLVWKRPDWPLAQCKPVPLVRCRYRDLDRRQPTTCVW